MFATPEYNGSIPGVLENAIGLAGAGVLDEELAIPAAHEAFTEDARLARTATRRRLAEILVALVAEVSPQC